MWKSWALSQASQTESQAMGGGVPRESSSEGQKGLCAGMPHDWRKQTLCAPGPREKDQCPRKRAGQTCLLVLEGLLWRWRWLRLTVGTETLAAAVLASTHWCEPSWRPPVSASLGPVGSRAGLPKAKSPTAEENRTIKKVEHQRIDAFKMWHCRRLSTVPWTARRSNQSILKEISHEYSLGGLMPRYADDTTFMT